MSALISAILNEQSLPHHSMSAQSVKPQMAASNADTATGSATISANDFLTLLVTEMKNQDPTANTDPNEYINQLVQVNSLQQLISINQTLSADATPKAAAGIVRNPAMAQAAPSSAGPQAAHPDKAPFNAARQLFQFSPATTIQGNLTVPSPNPAAHRIAESLGIPSRAQ